jgi:primosomal protein N' (replication factor Y) (superfamily II helicase)
LTPRVARVVPDVTGLDKEFDYLVPEDLTGEVGPGSIVRVPLHGRRVRGWVVALDPADRPVATEQLRPIARLSSRGPDESLLDLARWAAVRWGVGRLRPFLVSASPPANVGALPARRRSGTRVEPQHPAAAALLQQGGGVLRLPPSEDTIPIVATAARLGPTLVVEPSGDRARLDAIRLRRAGLTVAHVPQEWAAAAAGVDVVIGARSAAWGPCPDLAATVVVDEHDEALQEERSPTWHARDVVLERARRAGAPGLLVSPCPTVAGLVAAHGRLTKPSIDAERTGWPIVEVVDRSRDEPWRTSLVTSPLIAHLRRPDRTVVCVHNTPGRARILACRTCRALARCARCDAAVGLADDGTFACRRCGAVRPAVCLACGGSAFANLKPGVTRLREELEAAAGRRAVSVTGRDDEPPAAGVYVGTEAVLHRVARADVVAFLDFDLELLAPRYRAAEQAMALLVRAARVVGPRGEHPAGRLLVQTYLPRHEVIQAALLADPGRVAEAESERRRALDLPPFAALATVSGPGSDDVAAALRAGEGLVVGGSSGRHVVRAASWDELGHALIAAPRPKGSRVRIEVDPPRA